MFSCEDEKVDSSSIVWVFLQIPKEKRTVCPFSYKFLREMAGRPFFVSDFVSDFFANFCGRRRRGGGPGRRLIGLAAEPPAQWRQPQKFFFSPGGLEHA